MSEPIEPLGVDKDPFYAAARRVEAILDEAVLSGALTPEERRAVGLYQRGMTVTVTSTVTTTSPDYDYLP